MSLLFDPHTGGVGVGRGGGAEGLDAVEVGAGWDRFGVAGHIGTELGDRPVANIALDPQAALDGETGLVGTVVLPA